MGSNIFGRMPIGYVVRDTVYPSPAFQVWLDTQLTRTGGVDASLTAVEYETAVGQPIAAVASTADSGPVDVFTVDIDGGPV